VKIGLAVWVALLTWSVGVQAAPSFDCAKSSTALEQVICGDDALGELDRKLAEAYAERKRGSGAADLDRIANDQKQWLHRRNAECAPPVGEQAQSHAGSAAIKPCIQAFYLERLGQLTAGIGDGPRPVADPRQPEPIAKDAAFAGERARRTKISLPSKISMSAIISLCTVKMIIYVNLFGLSTVIWSIDLKKSV